MDEIKAFFEGLGEILDKPIVIGGFSITILGIIALVIKMFLNAPKSKKINEIRIDLSATRKEQQNFVTKDEFNALLDYSKKVSDFNYKVLDTIKKEGTKIALKNELAEIESQAPKELVVVVEEKPKEKVITRF